MGMNDLDSTIPNSRHFGGDPFEAVHGTIDEIWTTEEVFEDPESVMIPIRKEGWAGPTQYLEQIGAREIQMDENRRLDAMLKSAFTPEAIQKRLSEPGPIFDVRTDPLKNITVAGIEIPIQTDPSVPPGRVEVRYPDGRHQFFNLDGM